MSDHAIGPGVLGDHVTATCAYWASAVIGERDAIATNGCMPLHVLAYRIRDRHDNCWSADAIGNH